MGGYVQIGAGLRSHLGYGEVRGCYFGKLGKTDHRTAVSGEGETFACDIDHFDAEKDPYPYPCEHFSTILCCELIQHLYHDPMHLMSKLNRIPNPAPPFLPTPPHTPPPPAVPALR